MSSPSLCSAGYAYDADDAFNLAFAISMAKRALGAELQRRGHLTKITYAGSDRMHSEFAGELVAAELNLSQRQLADYRIADIERWSEAWIARATPVALASDAA